MREEGRGDERGGKGRREGRRKRRSQWFFKVMCQLCPSSGSCLVTLVGHTLS
jgi:hypothetical protein